MNIHVKNPEFYLKYCHFTNDRRHYNVDACRAKTYGLKIVPNKIKCSAQHRFTT